MADPADRNELEPSDISSALDVEQLDLNLYRSRNLSLNFDAPVVFGGQVISQAVVAATKCVNPEFTLHVRGSCTSPLYTHATLAHFLRSIEKKSLHVRTLIHP